MHDVIIIGSGPAGLTAAMFTARAQLKTLVIGRKEKSQLVYAKNVQNYFGFPEGIDGDKLLDTGIKQAEKWGAEIKEEEAVNITKNKTFKIKTTDNTYEAKAIIIATGIPIQWANIKGEKELLGKGVHTCPSCDGPIYKGKKLAVIGNGDYAAEDAIELTSYTKDITIISHAPKFTFNKKIEEQLKKNKIKLKIARVKEFVADKFLKKITFEDGSQEEFDGAYLACGTAGATTFAAKLGIETEEGLIKVDENGMTNAPGAFAAGNCMGKCRQIAKNVGDGCNAGIGAIRFLKSKETFIDYAK